MFFERDHAALIVFQGIRQTAGLRAITAAGAAASLRVGDIALPEYATHSAPWIKNSMVGIRRLVNIADLIQVQLARQHDLGKARIGEKASPSRRCEYLTSAGVAVQLAEYQLQYAHV